MPPSRRTSPADPAPQETAPKFTAILSDVHSNIDALKAVLVDISQWNCTTIVCLGDVIGYGASEAECLRAIRDLCAITVLGNHEAMLLTVANGGDWLLGQMRAAVRKPIERALTTLTSEEIRWIRTLPLVANLDPITLCHASLDNPPAFNYIHDENEAVPHFAAQTTHVSFLGHTHVPAIWKDKGGRLSSVEVPESAVRLARDARYAINVGSVGQPRDDDPRASYMLYDYKERLLLPRRVSYDIERAVARGHAAGLPAWNQHRLEKGH